MIEDLRNIMIAEGLTSVKEYLETLRGYYRAVLVVFIIVSVVSLFVNEFFYTMVALGIIFYLSLTFSKIAAHLETSINEIWEKYWNYKLKNLSGRGISRSTYEGFTIIKLNKGMIVLKLILLIVALYVVVVLIPGDMLADPYIFSAISLVLIYLTSIMVTDMLIPSISFVRIEIMQRQREIFSSLKSSTTAFTLASLMLLYLSVIFSRSFQLIYQVPILNILYFIGGILIGKAALNWYKVLFEVRAKPIEEPLITVFFPVLLSIASIFYIHYVVMGILQYVQVTEGAEAVISLIVSAILVPVIYFKKFFNKFLSEIMTSVINSKDREIEEEITRLYSVHNVSRVSRILRGLLAVILFVALVNMIIYTFAMKQQLFNEDVFIYMLTLISFFLGISYGFTKYSDSIIYYCLESLKFERRKYIAAERIIERRERKEETPPTMPELEDFDTILKDLERILEEE